MNINQKIYFHIGSGTSTDQLFALLETVHSGNKYEIDELMNDSNTQFLVHEEIKLTGNSDNSGLFPPEGNAYVVVEGTTQLKNYR